jgi:hypothetical protein
MMGRRAFGFENPAKGGSEVHRVRGVINGARIKNRYDGRRVDPGMTPEIAIARLEEDV